MLLRQFGPPLLEVLAHAVAGRPHRGVVLVEHLAVVEYLPDVGDEIVAGFVTMGDPKRGDRNQYRVPQIEMITRWELNNLHHILEALLDGRQIHRVLDDLTVRGELFGVHR